MKKILPVFCLYLAALLALPHHARSDQDKVYVGMNAEFSHPTSTSDDAIRQGILIAIDEINRTGGVLGGRRIELVERDNRSVPARAVQHNRELADKPDMVAVFGGKFSSAIIESLPVIHEKKLLMMTPWSANNKVVDNGYRPNYVFRLSITDTWAVDAMLNHALKNGLTSIGLLLPNNSWGRSNDEVIQKFVAGKPRMKITTTQWYNYGEKSLSEKYSAILKSGAKAVVLVAIETEGSLLVREMAQLPRSRRLPVISHASITGGDFVKMAGEALHNVDMVFPQTYYLSEGGNGRAKSVLEEAKRLFGIRSPAEIKSPMGLVHAYDLMQILARAINQAGSTDRARVHAALENITDYDGLIMHYSQPFTEGRHDALSLQNVTMSRYDVQGIIRKIK